MAKDAVGYALGALNKLASSDFLDKVGLRKFIERLAYTLTKTGFRVVTTTARTFKASQKLDKPQRLHAPGQTTDLFDLSITEEQQMIRDSVKSFATEVLRDRGEAADAAHRTDDDVLASALELGLNFFAVPESLGGAATERSAVTNMLIAEDLAYGDMGQAVAILAPMGVANALTSWGSADQQARYLPPFAGETPPKAAIAVAEPQPLFDPNQLKTSARKDGDSYVLTGQKSLVPLAAEAELFLVAAQTDDGPAVFIVEGGSEGLSCGEDNGMGIRA